LLRRFRLRSPLLRFPWKRPAQRQNLLPLPWAPKLLGAEGWRDGKIWTRWFAVVRAIPDSLNIAGWEALRQ
jgi:hypothetical protein